MALTVTRDANAFTVTGHQYQVTGTLAFDSSYPTGGETLTPNDFGLQYIEDIDCRGKNGYVFDFDKTNVKLLVHSASGGGGERILTVNTTAVVATTTSAAALMSYTLPAGTLSSNGMGLKIRVWGTDVTGANNKTKRLCFGTSASVLLTTGAQAASATDWFMEATLVRTGATASEAYATGFSSATFIVANQVEVSDTLSSALAIFVEGTSATATGGITQEGMIVSLFTSPGGAGGQSGEVSAATDLSSLTGVRYIARGV